MKELNKVRTIIFAATLMLQLSTLNFHSRGAAGDVDLSFDAGSGINGPVYAVVVQPDGKVIIGGEFTTVKGLARSKVARLNADGSGDSSFTAGAYGAVYALALQPDGKVLIGHQDGYARLNSNGSKDTSFIEPTSDPDYGYTASIVVQPDGKVLVGGYQGGSGIARLNSNGSPDTNFNVWPDIYGIYGPGVFSMALQSDGKVLVGGNWITSGGTNSGIARLNADGSLDTSFNPGRGVTETVYSLALQGDGKVVIGGDFIRVNGTNRSHVARLNTDGSLDSSFNPIIGIGYYPSGVRSLAIQSNGKVLIGGDFRVGDTNQYGIARLNVNGSLDDSFDPGSGVNSRVSSVALQSNGKVLVGGLFTAVNGTNRNRIARLNADGSVDSSFYPGRALESPVYSIGVYPDGKVQAWNVRLYPDGSLDTTYVPPVPTNGPVFPADISFPGSDYTIATCGAVQADGKVFIGGYFATTYEDPEGGITRWTQYFLTRFNADASRDTNFAQLIGYPDYGMSDPFTPMGLLLQPEGKVLYTLRSFLKRLNSNGTVDSNFVANVGAVSFMRLQADGKIFIVGGFAHVNGTNRGGIARLNANGSLDDSFDPGTGANGKVSTYVFQPDGKILIGGQFTAVNGTNRNDIARLNANGSLDLSFNPGTGTDGVVYSIALQPDGNVLIGGAFLTVNGVLRPNIARLIGDSPWPSLNITRANASLLASWPVMGLHFQLQESTNLSLPNAWSSVAQSAVTNAGRISVTVPTTAGRKFFRLSSQ